MTEGLLSVAGITTIVALLFTLLFQYVPGLRVKWAAQSSDTKRVIVLGVYLITGAIVAFGGCFPAFANALGLPLMCVALSSFVSFAFGVLVAIGAGQGVFSLLPELADVAAVKDARPE